MDKDMDSERLMERIHGISHRLTDFLDMLGQITSESINGLSKLEISVLVRLYKNPSIIMRELSEELRISKSSMTGIVDHLEELGYLCRVINKCDRRSYALEITEEGKIAQLKHEEYERLAILRFIEAMKMCDVSENYLDETEKLLDFICDQTENIVYD
jgi:MarR family transcriptional regulator, organic hydroperoxide resistance regulator